jgi:hypothetical protein
MLRKIVEEKYRDITGVTCFIIVGVVFFFLSGSSSFQITTNFLTNNSFASPNATLFTPANRVLFNFQYRYTVLFLIAVVAIKLIYRIYSINRTRKINKKLHNYLDVYIDSFSYSIFIVFLAILAGLQDLSTIFFVLVTSFIGSSLILLNTTENEIEVVSKNKKIGIILSSISWLLLVIYSVSTLTYGGVRATVYVYLLDLLGLLYLFFIYSKNKSNLLRKIKKQDRESIKYTFNLFIKLAFLVILSIGLH